MKSQAHIPFWMKFYSLPCLVVASPGWKKYFQKYFSGTSFTFPRKIKGVHHITIYIRDTTDNTNHIVFEAVYHALSCKITTRSLDHSVFPMISNTVQRLFTRLIYQKNGLVLHASAVLRKKRAYIFIGHSGAGKTTAAQISTANGCEVIADNFVFITKNTRGYVLLPFPFDQFHNRVRRPPIIIMHAYILQKSTGVSFVPIEGGRWTALQRYAQIQVPDGKDAATVNPKFLFNFIHSVTMYRLQFTKIDNFWLSLP